MASGNWSDLVFFQDPYLCTLLSQFQGSLASGVREVEVLRRELDSSNMERSQLQSRVEELLERAADADRLREELERLKVL